MVTIFEDANGKECVDAGAGQQQQPVHEPATGSAAPVLRFEGRRQRDLGVVELGHRAAGLGVGYGLVEGHLTGARHFRLELQVAFGDSEAGTTIGSSEFFSEFCLKISANEVLITARNPNWVSAHGACSRELPQPKLSPASRICAPARARLCSG
jgi:hypothetical protein